jgi:hypothetical protein
VIMPNYQPNETRRDGINWHAFAHVDKYDPEVVRELTQVLGYEPKAADFKRLAVTPNSVAEADGNLLTTAGLQRITNLIIGSGAAAFTSTQSVVGVGDTSTAATVSDTDLGAATGSTHRWLQATDSAPTAVNGVLTAVSTFASANGNFAWNEWCWVVSTGTITAAGVLIDSTHPGSTGNQILNHKIASLGTKASGASWVFTTTVTLS